MELVYGLVVVLYVLVCVGAACVAAATPFFLLFQAWRALRGRHARRRTPISAELALREQYAAGLLTLSGLEERLDEALRQRPQPEVAPPRRLPRVAAFEVAAGVGVLLVSHGAPGRAVGAALALGALAPSLRWRPLVAAFAAGLTLLVAPLAALPLGASAAWRFVIRE